MFYLELPSFYSRLKARRRVNNARSRGVRGRWIKGTRTEGSAEETGAGETKACLDWSLKSRISSSDEINHLGSLDVLVLLQHGFCVLI